MLNSSLSQSFWKIFSTIWLWEISTWPLHYHHVLATGKLWESLIQVRLKGYYNNTINVRISLHGYGSKIRKKSRCRTTVSNETILATKQELCFRKVGNAIRNTIHAIHNWHCAIGFLINTAPANVISSYITIYFFLKNFSLNVYISVNTTFECSYLPFGWQYVHN